jgi:hypothetical protein
VRPLFYTLFNISTDNDGRTCDFCNIRVLNAMPFVPTMAYGRATPCANGVANDLFLAYMFCNTKDLGLLRSSTVYCADPRCPGASTLTVRKFCDGHVGGSHLLPHALLSPQSRIIQRFSRVTSVSCSSRKTSSQAHLPSFRVLSTRNTPSPLP